MAEFILKDRYGKDRTFDKEAFFVKGADGELMQFTHGTGNPVIESLEITENGTYTAPEGVDGYNPVVVAVPAPEIKLQDKTITENGEYTADSGFDGLGKVTVEVKGSGGGSLPTGLYLIDDCDNMYPPNSYYQRHIIYNGYLYSISYASTTLTNVLYFYKYNSGTWDLKTSVTLSGKLNQLLIQPKVFNGKIHLCGCYSRTDHVVYDDENGAVLLNPVPNAPSDDGYRNTFVEDGKLKYFAGGSYNKVYVWNESTDTWTLEATLDYNAPTFFDHKGTAYIQEDNVLYKYVSGNITKLYDTADRWIKNYNIVGDYLYYISNSIKNSANEIYKINLLTGEETYIGRIPSKNVDDTYNLLYFENKFHYMGANNSSRQNLILHEVTE